MKKKNSISQLQKKEEMGHVHNISYIYISMKKREIVLLN